MARINIDVSVNGEEKLDKLDKQLDEIDKKKDTTAAVNVDVKGEEQLDTLNKTLKETDDSFKKVSESSQATSTTTKDVSESTLDGVIKFTKYAAAAAAVATAIHEVWEVGSKYNKQLEETNDYIAKTSDLEDDLAGSIGAAAGQVLKATGAWDTYRSGLSKMSSLFDGIAISMGGVGETTRRITQWMKGEEEQIKKVKDERTKAAAKAHAQAIQDDIDNQKLLSKLEEKVRKEQEAADRKVEIEKKKQAAVQESIYTEELAKMGLNKYGDEIAATKTKTDTYKTATDKASESVKKTETSVGKTKTTMGALADATRRATGELYDYDEALDIVIIDNRAFSSTLDDVVYGLDTVRSDANRAAGAMRTYASAVRDATNADTAYYNANTTDSYYSDDRSRASTTQAPMPRPFEYELLKAVKQQTKTIKELDIAIRNGL